MGFEIPAIENNLVKLCLANDRLAQKQLYHRYKDAMYTLAMRMCGDSDAAEDVLQDAFVNIFRNLQQFRAESTLGAWIKTIVVRTALKSIRKQIHFEPIEHLNTDGYVDWGHYLDAEYLEKAIFSLPEGYRTVFVLIEVEGYAHKEVAEMLQISVGTSKSQLFYAKKRLRNLVRQLM